MNKISQAQIMINEIYKVLLEIRQFVAPFLFSRNLISQVLAGNAVWNCSCWAFFNLDIGAKRKGWPVSNGSIILTTE